jgi:uncharacterized protein YjiS (DUF1127 family)
MHNPTLSLKTGPATLARRALQDLSLSLSEALAGWQRARQARATVQSLDALDERLLHDIGLHRSELLSVAAEVHGQAERERLHALRATLLLR